MAENCLDACDPRDAPTAEALEGNYFVSAYPPFSCWSPAADQAYRQILASALEPPPPLGLYVHVPFCAQRCDYCYYRTYAGRPHQDKDAYVAAVLAEADLYRQQPSLAGRQVEFVYFGGGTPSLLTDLQIERLLGGLQPRLPWSKGAEVTFECAPKTVTRAKVQLLRQLGVTRLSLGVQPFDDAVLAANGRIHLVADVKRAYELVREAEFPVVNLDLIVGLVGETDRTFYRSVERCAELAADCVTIYPLEVPHNSTLFHRLQEHSVPLPPGWAIKRRRLRAAFAWLERSGYTLRSAYAAVRNPDRARFVYQDAQYRGADLLGLGVASFSYLSGCHFQNLGRLERYLECLAQRQLPFQRGYLLNVQEQMVREFVLQLKLGRVERGHFQAKFGVDVAARFGAALAPLRAAGWIATDDDAIRLTREGLLRVDRLLPGLYLPEHQGAPAA